MEIRQTIRHIRAALLIAGSASCIYACGRGDGQEEENYEGLLTQKAENLRIIESENGKLSSRFQAPLMETYEYDREPFREFRRGIYVETFSDSTNTVESTLEGDYAINYIDRQLWEVKGNVVATNANGQKLETQQLFWNQRTGRIYSNVDSKLTQGSDVIIGVGFESDEQFTDWEFRRPRGTVEVDTSQTEGAGEDDDMDDGEFTVTVRDREGNEKAAEEAPESETAPAEEEAVEAEIVEEASAGGTVSSGRRMRSRPGVAESPAPRTVPAASEIDAARAEGDGEPVADLYPAGGEPANAEGEPATAEADN